VQTYARTFGLEISKLPFESPSFDLAITSHARLQADPATNWFKNTIKRIMFDNKTSPRLESTARLDQLDKS
jgi:hypothetical protein